MSINYWTVNTVCVCWCIGIKVPAGNGSCICRDARTDTLQELGLSTVCLLHWQCGRSCAYVVVVHHENIWWSPVAGALKTEPGCSCAQDRILTFISLLFFYLVYCHSFYDNFYLHFFTKWQQQLKGKKKSAVKIKKTPDCQLNYRLRIDKMKPRTTSLTRDSEANIKRWYEGEKNI